MTRAVAALVVVIAAGGTILGSYSYLKKLEADEQRDVAIEAGKAEKNAKDAAVESEKKLLPHVTQQLRRNGRKLRPRRSRANWQPSETKAKEEQARLKVQAEKLAASETMAKEEQAKLTVKAEKAAAERKTG